ncbi:glycosyltransferase [Chloroflexota bacterium]
MKVAIIHEYFCNMGGSEAVVSVLHQMFPQAPIYTIVAREKHRKNGILKGMDVRTSFVQHLPFASSRYKLYLPLFPLAVEQFNLKGYDLVISSSHSCAKGIITRPETLHICYCHTPMRYAWDLYHDYLDQEIRGRLAKLAASLLMHYLRLWDASAAARVDHFIANSEHVAQRIQKHYRREATVIYPPVDTDYFLPQNNDGNFFLMVSRLTSYKRVGLAVAAFNELGLPLKIIGSGPEFKRLKRQANPNVELLGWQPREVVREHFATCRALIFPGQEDFGIVPLEAHSAGRPVIAYAAGGVLETVVPGETGVFFEEQTPDSLKEAVIRFQDMKFDKKTIRNHALRFDRNHFVETLKRFIQEKYKLYYDKGTKYPKSELLSAAAGSRTGGRT